jgi:hypothetical protein
VALQEIEHAAVTVFVGTAPFGTDGAASERADHARDAAVGHPVGTAVNAFLERA